MVEELLVERREAAGWLTLNRTNDLNSLNWELLKSLDIGLTELLSDQSVRTIVFTGAGRAFCAGADLKFIEALAITRP